MLVEYAECYQRSALAVRSSFENEHRSVHWQVFLVFKYAVKKNSQMKEVSRRFASTPDDDPHKMKALKRVAKSLLADSAGEFT